LRTVVEDHVERFAARESGDALLNTPGVLFLGLTLPSD
jgi:hypothetical protein